MKRSFLKAITLLTLLACDGELPLNVDQDGGAAEKMVESDTEDPKIKPEPKSGDELVENPDVTLPRVYWKLFRHSDNLESCYFIPRPDNNPYAIAQCDADTSLGQTMAEYQLCNENVDPEVINNIPCDEALTISTHINNSLVFDQDFPYPYEEDRVAACGLPECESNSDLVSYCQYYQDRQEALASGAQVPAIARSDSDEERQAIAVCLNKLYETKEPEQNALCTDPKPGDDYVCQQDCGPPVAMPNDPPPLWRWVTAEEAKNREQFGCPICLAPATRIATPKGEIAIHLLKKGDLIYTRNDLGEKIVAPLSHVGSTPAPAHHQMVHLQLSDGRFLLGSPGHPLSSGRNLGDLMVGDRVDGALVRSVDLTPYGQPRTFDILPAAPWRGYWAEGIPLESTLHHPNLHSSR